MYLCNFEAIADDTHTQKKKTITYLKIGYGTKETRSTHLLFKKEDLILPMLLRLASWHKDQVALSRHAGHLHFQSGET